MQWRSDEDSVMDTSQLDLHELAGAYADGEISFEQYRLARRQLLDRLTEDVTIVVRQPEYSEKVEAHISAQESTVVPRGLSIRLLSGLLVALFVMIAVVFWLAVF